MLLLPEVMEEKVLQIENMNSKSLKPQISIIVPVYNGERYINEFFLMISKQTYKNFEVVLVNDGSTDKTEEICKRKCLFDERFQLFNKANGGVSSARNYGLKVSKGEYIAFVDVDDYFYPEYIEKLYTVLKKYNADWSQCAFVKVNENYNYEKYEICRNNISDDSTIEKNVMIFDNKNAMIDFAYRRNLNCFSCTKLIKTELASQISFKIDLKYAEDYCFIFELIKLSRKVAYINSVEYLYIQHLSSAIHKMDFNYFDYHKSWVAFGEIYKELALSNPIAAKGVMEKRYMQAIRNISRIECAKDENYNIYADELFMFIRNNGKSIFLNKQNGMMNRLLGLGGFINPYFICFVMNLLFANGFYLRRTS